MMNHALCQKASLLPTIGWNEERCNNVKIIQYICKKKKTTICDWLLDWNFTRAQVLVATPTPCVKGSAARRVTFYSYGCFDRWRKVLIFDGSGAKWRTALPPLRIAIACDTLHGWMPLGKSSTEPFRHQARGAERSRIGLLFSSSFDTGSPPAAL